MSIWAKLAIVAACLAGGVLQTGAVLYATDNLDKDLNGSICIET